MALLISTLAGILSQVVSVVTGGNFTTQRATNGNAIFA